LKMYQHQYEIFQRKAEQATSAISTSPVQSVAAIVNREPTAGYLLNEALTGTRGDPLLTSFLRYAARISDRFRESHSLCYAICTYMASQLYPENRLRIAEFRSLAHQSLNASMDADRFGALEVFGTFVLAWWACYFPEPIQAEQLRHFDVYICGLRQTLSSPSRYLPPDENQKEQIERAFALIGDKALWMLAVEKNEDLFTQLENLYSPFSLRLLYFVELRENANPKEAWQDSWLEAVNDMLCDLLRLLLICVYDFAKWEAEYGLPVKPSMKNAIIRFVENRLNDFSLRWQIAKLEIILRCYSDQLLVQSDDGQEKEVMELQIAQRATILLLLDIMRSSTILQGFSRASNQAESLCRSLKLQKRITHPIIQIFYHDYSLIGITFAGLALGMSRNMNRMTAIYNPLTCR
jgi:hypothetical protein